MSDGLEAGLRYRGFSENINMKALYFGDTSGNCTKYAGK